MTAAADDSKPLPEHNVTAIDGDGDEKVRS
eukprot:COSAG04_NODE_5905_length_1457_cov_1.421324_2_plen_30_part_00